MILNRKIKRSILESKSLYIGSVLLIIISCLLFTLLSLLSNNMKNITSSFEKDYVQDDASFTAGNKLNVNELESKFNVQIEEGGSFDYDFSNNKTLRIFSQNVKIDIPAVVAGKPLSGNDILLEPAYAKANNLKIGDEMQIYKKSFKIAGFMTLPNYIYPLKSESDLTINPESFGIAVISKDDFNQIDQGNNFYSIKFNPNNGSIETQESEFKNYLKSINVFISQWTDISDNARVNFVDTKIHGISAISSSLPVFIILLTCLLTGIIIWRLLKRESIIIGTLYAEGYRKKEIRKHYFSYPLSIAITGGIIGTLLGALLLKPMLDYMVGYFNIPENAIYLNPAYIIVSLLLPLIFLGISGVFVLNKELRYSPVELMRGGRDKNKINYIEHRLNLDRLKFSTKFKIREQLRSLSRLAFLFLGVVVATILLLLGFTAKSSIERFMNGSLTDAYKFQYEYVYNTLHQERQPSDIQPFNASTFTYKSDSKISFIITGIASSPNYITLKDKNGAVLDTNQVIITRPLADKLHVAPGDSIGVINKLDSKKYIVKIDSIAEAYIGDLIYMPISQFNTMLKLPVGSYTGIWSNKQLNIPENLLYSSRSINGTIKAFNASTQPIQVTIGVIAFLSFLIGLIVIYVVTSLIIEENKRNISLMKILGYRKKEINSLIINSTFIIVIIGYITGIPLVLALMRVLFNSLTKSINFSLPVVINYSYIVLGFVVVYLTFELSKALSRKKIDRITMSDALKEGIE